MRKVCQVLAVAALALGLLVPMHQAYADATADLEAVERELEAEATALKLYRRAHERALKAVQASSLAAEHERLSDASSEAWELQQRAWDAADRARDRADKAWDAAHEARDQARRESIGAPTRAGEDAIGASIRVMNEWRENDQTRPLAEVLSQEASELRETAAVLLDDYLALSDKRGAVHSRMYALVQRMTLKFLADEIAQAVEQGLGDLERELRELEKKARKGVTI